MNSEASGVEENRDLFLQLARDRNDLNFMTISGRLLVEGLKKAATKVWAGAENVMNYLDIDSILRMVKIVQNKPIPQIQQAPDLSVQTSTEPLILTFLKGQAPLKATLFGAGIFLGGLMSLSLSGRQTIKISSFKFGKNAQLKCRSTDGIQFAGIFYGLSRESSMQIDNVLQGLLNLQLTVQSSGHLRTWIARSTMYPFIFSIVTGEAVYVAINGPFRIVKGRFENGRVTPINVEIDNRNISFWIGETSVEQADRFILIASENIWNVLGDQGVVDSIPVVATRKAAEHLVKKAARVALYQSYDMHATVMYLH